MRKKLRIVLMLCVLVITVCGCKKRQEPVFLLEPAYCNSEGLEKFVEFKSSADYGLSIVKDIVELDNVEKNIIPSFESDEEYEYSYSFVAKASLNGKDELYSQYNMYENSDNSIEVSYLDGTDIVTTYFNKGVIRQAVGAQPVSKEEALELSIDFLKKINSAKLINEYEYDESKDKEDEEYYYFDLVRKVNGYDTDDIIDVSVKKVAW